MSTLTTQSDSGRCDKPTKTRASDGSVSLPVLGSEGGKTPHAVKLGGSRTGRWRAAVLLLINLIMAVHIIQWIYFGTTLSPVEPSESMQTLEEGIVNTGFVFFSAALLSTLIFGRFFCGWGCHIVSVQDACSWLMSRAGVRPKPFRSRLMLWIPLGVGTYMFVWPSFKRYALTPLLGDEFGRLPNWLGTIPPIDRITSEFMVENFWATFAPWYVAIPFFFVVGIAIVYFLGNKGFCTYGCPYGGFFAPLDLVAPGKIRVTDACEGCGHCTAVCTSNVRVHEEVRDFGMVVNPGCMKCMDCVNTCPNDALYFGFGTPAVLAKPRTDEAKERRRSKKSSLKQFDLSRGQEFLAIGLFLFFVWGYRSFLNEVPLLMGVGMAAIAVFIAWKLWGLLRVPNVRIQNVQLRLKGKLRPAGLAFAVLGVIYLAAGVWGAAVRWELWKAEQAYLVLEESGPTIPQAIQPGFVALPEHASAAREARRHYERTRTPWNGGFGWGYSKEALARLAYLNSVLGEFDAAEAMTRELLSRQKPNDNIVIDLGRIMQRQGKPIDAITAELRHWLTVEPTLVMVRNELAQALRSVNKSDEASAEFERGATTLRASEKTEKFVGPTLRDHAYFELSAGNVQKAQTLFKQAIQDAGENGLDVIVPSAAGLMQAGLAVEAEAALEKADALAIAAAHPPNSGTVLNIARGFQAIGKADRAQAIARRVAGDKRDAQGMYQAGVALAQFGQVQEAITIVDDAATAAERKTRKYLGKFHRPGAASLNISAGSFMIQAGRADRGHALIEQGVTLGDNRSTFQMQAAAQYLGLNDAARAVPLLERAATARTADASLRHDLAVAYMMSNRPADAITAMRAAAEMDPTNPEFAARLAQIYRESNQPAEAEKWELEAAKRGGVKK